MSYRNAVRMLPLSSSDSIHNRDVISFALFVLAAVDFVPIPASVTETLDAATGMKRAVRIDGFEISRTEIRQREYESVTGANPSAHTGPDLPVENVSWFDAIRFANAYSASKGVEPCYDVTTGQRIRPQCRGYRLPTDAEWYRAFETRDDPTNSASANLGLEQTSNAVPLDRLATRAVDDTGKGVRDLAGNVWEWCEDWFRPVTSPWPLHNPRGALRGLTRVVRGGSFHTTRTSWSRSLRSSLDPNARSRHTGIRLVRSTGQVAPMVPEFDTQAAPQKKFESVAALRAKPSIDKWLAVLGEPRGLKRDTPPNVRLLRTFEDGFLQGKIMEYESEPGVWEKFAVMDGALPAERALPRPVVIVPYYDVDTPAGMDLAGRGFNNLPAVWFARHAAQMGFIAVAVRWFGESDGERYDEVVANLRQRQPGLTGLGKWVWDSKRLIDYIETIPGVDKNRIGMIGHSLGGKMTLYAAATDPRIRAAVVSEPGIAFGFTNYNDYWYLGERLAQFQAGTDQHELIGLIAPRPLLLIAGEESDGDKSWPYLEAARGLYPNGADLGWLNHRSGHTPSVEAVAKAMVWLAARLER